MWGTGPVIRSVARNLTNTYKIPIIASTLLMIIKSSNVLAKSDKYFMPFMRSTKYICCRNHFSINFIFIESNAHHTITAQLNLSSYNYLQIALSMINLIYYTLCLHFNHIQFFLNKISCLVFFNTVPVNIIQSLFNVTFNFPV